MIIGYLDPEGMICFGGIRGGGGLVSLAVSLARRALKGDPRQQDVFLQPQCLV